MAPSKLSLPAAAALLLLLLAHSAAAQSCGCASGQCCSQHGFCGTGAAYCGRGCQAGPCAVNGVSVAGVVTGAFFDALTAQAAASCEARGFYTRDAFLAAAGHYPTFARTGTADDSRREIAAFFAHVNHETIKFCYINEINGASKNYCDTDPKYAQWPCQAGKGYYGRGPLQISWNYNYGAAGRSIGFDGLRDPDAVARSALTAFRSALWYWMTNVPSVSDQGFGATIRAINGALECDGKNANAVSSRVGYYRQLCQQLGVDPGSNLTC